MPRLARKCRAKHVIYPHNNTILINGIGMRYDAGFPKELYPHISVVSHFKTMLRINNYLRANFPPPVNCTCAETGPANCQKFLFSKVLYLSLIQLLDEETAKYNNTVTWFMQERMNMLTHRMEYVLEIQYNLTISCDK